MIAIRRTQSTSAPMSPSAARAGAARRRSRSGITRSLEMVIGERDALDHHHSGRRREAAHHRQERHAMRAGAERQRENRQVAIERRRAGKS